MTKPPALIELTTPRLVLRPWRASDAPLMRELWIERDPRVPPHRRIDSAGNPSLETIRDQILQPREPLGLLAAEARDSGDVVGYCGLTGQDPDFGGEPQIAFEFLQRMWGRGLATEAGAAVVEWADQHGIERLWATVWDWNVASRRVLDKLGFTMTEQTRVDPDRGTTLVAMRQPILH